MAIVRKVFAWFFRPLQPPFTSWRVFLWWEARRIPYNIFVAFYGTVCLAIYFWAIVTSGILEPGEDAIEPLAIIIFAPVAVNVAYTLGWVAEIPLRRLRMVEDAEVGVRFLVSGVVFSVGVITLPAAYWVWYRVLQFAHVIK